jgi:hypothetical protein
MKTEVEVQSRIDALLVRELNRRVSEAKKRLPRLCMHNYRHPLDDRKVVEGAVNEHYNHIREDFRTIGLCTVGQLDPESWEGTICEDDIDAMRCSLFEPKKSKDVILDEFIDQLHTPGWVEEHMPGLAELLWVADNSILRIPWWKKVWYHWILRLRVEPVSVSKALPENTSLRSVLGGDDESCP